MEAARQGSRTPERRSQAKALARSCKKCAKAGGWHGVAQNAAGRRVQAKHARQKTARRPRTARGRTGPTNGTRVRGSLQAEHARGEEAPRGTSGARHRLRGAKAPAPRGRDAVRGRVQRSRKAARAATGGGASWRGGGEVGVCPAWKAPSVITEWPEQAAGSKARLEWELQLWKTSVFKSPSATECEAAQW